ncbi:unnamed protein product [Effrenium voratum]|uniref:Uncharacterized protein n=1 Tax=Effrenium voratum TaxID=2562239 RepID=A0AA36HLP6_9DINO|nr:unnamed protein product [Effrenium voratum]|mmetsp:Transcript_126170/g.299593  ORF Transcript_126170/g.299593 Transcript_126170/m.299593 type:complete len:128 (-) Transcript_126170:181-564(-)|eukprot:CAMPEP_0181459898 /NCGR_PEP_ID=MMETSP1110-20121109/33064_1 /TAXON_ID=174948 /ORGANISM="Symbiodinium sp., Strain CCMP421" /LENGTH=127 /DNA_ID=CAMNT_0023584435 /DNA_START=83 /DNA_END=466 /DNA_ORIENTATION=+
MASEATPAPLYQDQFVEIYADHLSIKTYYFPFGQDTRVDLPSESGTVSFATDRDLGFTWKDKKSWGMAFNNVWWALDFGREFRQRHLGIVITVGDHRFRKGFSVEKEEAALKVLDSLLPRTKHPQSS